MLLPFCNEENREGQIRRPLQGNSQKGVKS
jgi:hypothetical protein